MNGPQQLGKYRIVSVLGEGAMGVVYKGYDPGIQRTVALKTIRRDLELAPGSGASAAQRFRVEAQAAGRLAHPGIVAVYDYGDEGDVSYIAMEYVEGSSLARYLAKARAFTDDDVASIAVQLLDALDHAHSHGVWHRDIKPANLLLTHEGRVKLADFGVARVDNTELTVAGSVIGTPGYMAPEQFLGQEIDSRVDIYAAGVMIYQLMVGRPPFSGSTEALLYRVVNEPPTLPSQVPGCERWAAFDGALGTALAKDKRNRFASPAAFRNAVLSAHGRQVPSRIAAGSLFPPTDAPTEVVPSSGSRPSSNQVPGHWDPALLAQVESRLARHIGPLATVLVRRTARACHDLPALYERLAEQVTSPSARHAFLAELNHTRGAATLRGSVGASAVAAGAVGGIDDALIAAATRALARHVGPIAAVMAKRAAGQAPNRAAYVTVLENALDDAASKKALRDELGRLV